jgi:hypothetical protein
VFCTDSENIFINTRPACRETEEGGEGERDTGITVRRVSPGTHSPRLPAVSAHWTGGEVPGRVPPPHTLPPFGQFEAAAADLVDSL